MTILNQSKVKWNGKWIWADYITPFRVPRQNRCPEKEAIKPSEKNVYCLFRKTFTIEKPIMDAVITVSVDSRYKLFVNGKYIGRGIYRAESFLWYYHTHDLTKFLKQGTNCLAFHARYYGEDFAYYTLPKDRKLGPLDGGKGGLIFELLVKYEDGSEEWIVSDDKTKVIVNSGEKSDCPLKNDALGRVQEFDSRKLAKEWNEIEFDDSIWKKPLILDYPIKTTYPWPYDYLHEEVVYPHKILECRKVPDFRYSDPDCDDDDPDNPKNLDWNICFFMENTDHEPYEIENSDALLGKGGVCVINPPEEEDYAVHIILRFPREMVGYPRIRVEGAPGTAVEFITAEVKTDGANMGYMNWEYKRGSKIILRGGQQFFEQWDWEGYTNLAVIIRDFQGQPVKIYDLATNNTHFNYKLKGSFECSDPKMNELWKACAFTLKCCGIDGYLDCPSREQRSYLGDAYPQAMIAFACFGNGGLTHKIIYDTAMGQREDGMTYSFHPGDAKEQNHIIPDYCLYWIQIIWDYYMYEGDDDNLSMLKDLYPRMINALKWFEKYIDPKTNLLTDIPHWTFVDWSIIDKKGAVAVVNAQFADCCRILSRIGNLIGDSSYSLYYIKLAKKIERAIQMYFWDEKMQVFRDNIFHGKHGEQITQHTNGYLMLLGLVPHEKKQELFSSIFDRPDEEIKKQLWAFSEELPNKYEKGVDVLVAQPFFMHHLNKLFAKMDRIDLMLKYVQWGWFPMLENSISKTIWETWKPEGSLCHAWAATPAFDFSTHILGIAPLEPGFKRILINPHFGDLKFAKGVFPTPKGDVYVEWSVLDKESVEFTIRIPKGTTAVCQPGKLNGKKPKLGDGKVVINETKMNFVVMYE